MAHPLDELMGFLHPDTRVDIKYMAVENLVALTGTEEGIRAMLSKDALIKRLIELWDDKTEEIAKHAMLLFVNLSSDSTGPAKLIKHKRSNKTFIDILVSFILNPNKKDADTATMILANLTRSEEMVDTCVDSLFPYMNDILNAFVNTKFNKRGADLEYLGTSFSNMSCNTRFRKWLTEGDPMPLLKILPFCNYAPSKMRRRGAVGTIHNLAFDLGYHTFLLRPDVDWLSYILKPMMGNEDYSSEEMEKLHITLQYLPKEKLRDPDAHIREMILETLQKLCTKREGREFLRDNGVYYVMREYHKWEKKPELRLACENIVDILIQTEDEVGAEDLSTVEVPEELIAKFQEMDKEYLGKD